MRDTRCAPRRVGATAGLAVLVASSLLMMSCGVTPRDAAGDSVDPSGHSGSDAVARAAPPETDRPFAVEEAMGARCRQNSGGDPPLQGAACYGALPEHLQSLLRNLPETHPNLTSEAREEAVTTKQWFRAVPGYGNRPDIVALITHYSQFWVRSFEGPDPGVTVYVVYGPACSEDPALSMQSVEDGCLPGAPHVVRELRIYRVTSEGLPEDVTSAIAPAPPALTAEERLRYGIYLRPPEEGGAVDTDIGLDVRRLATTPVMRWTIDPPEEGDYVRPRIPDSDPRGGFGHLAHFGFLVWTGKRFELRERVPLLLWACGIAGQDDGCSMGDRGDPYLIEDGAAAPGAAGP